MTKTNRILSYFLGLFILSFTSCQESALSDVALTDPGLIEFHANLTKSFSSGVRTESINTILLDKNNDQVELKDGNVYVNNVKMSLNRDFFNLPYYTLNGTPNIQDDSTYTIKVVFADTSIVCTSTITLEENNLDSFNVAVSHVRTEPLTITWTAIDEAYNVRLGIVKRIVNDTATENRSLNDIVISSSMDSYTFPATFLTDSDGTLNKITFTLKSEETGSVDSKFNSGYIKCLFKNTKEIVITD